MPNGEQPDNMNLTIGDTGKHHTLRGRIMYSVERGILGSKVIYRCGGCGLPLVMPLRHAGQRRPCATCRRAHVVPGAAEKQARWWRRLLAAMRSSQPKTEIRLGPAKQDTETPAPSVRDRDRRRYRVEAPRASDQPRVRRGV